LIQAGANITWRISVLPALRDGLFGTMAPLRSQFYPLLKTARVICHSGENLTINEVFIGMRAWPQ
jgi:hypothetical protein